MVSYGNSLRLARRSGWEGAYLDYDKLQKSLRKIDELFTTAVRRQETNKHRDDDEEEETPLLTTAVDSAGHASTPRMTQERLLTQLATLGKSFMMDLQAEIEKVSLFYLKKQGELADAVGALRFNQNLKNAAFSTTDALALISTYQGITFDATDEREVFSVLGVEVLHLLRFIGINSTAVRKILKKYRKLVLNVIKALNKTAQTDERLDEELQDSIINELQYSSALNSFDSSLPNAKTFRFSLDNHLQQLVNSGSINAIQASFLAALKESEEESQRHPAGITQPDSAKLRLKFVLVSIQTIRENAEIVNHSFQNFISRKAMIATGTSLGEIEGSTLDALHMLLRFEPDSILYMSDKDLRQWHQMVRGGSPLKTITKGQSRRHYRSMSGIPISIPETDEEDDVASEASKKQWGGVDSISLAINLSSVLLYTVNYYIVAPNANNYAVLLGHDGAYGATLIGASSFAALFAAFVYSVWYIKLSFKSALIFSSMCPLLGNIMYSLAVSYHSMTMALMGRILCGFGSAEVVNRQLISACVSFERMTRASAFFVAAGAAGMSIGPLLGSIFDLLAGRDHQVDVHLESTPAGGIVYDHVTAPGFFMALLWFFQLIVLVFFFEEPERVNGSDDSDFYDMDDLQRESSIVSTKSDDCAPYGSMIKNVSSHDLIALNSDRELRLSVNESSGKSSKSTLQMLLSEIRLTMRLVFGKPALPVTLLLFCYIEMADEVLISSCSMITRRYFGWHGSKAGFLIACLGALVLPADFVVEHASHYFSERKIMKYSVIFIIFSLIAILNYTGLYYDIVGYSQMLIAEDIEHVRKDVKIHGRPVGKLLHNGEFPYNWGLGKFAYILFLSSVFMGTIILEGVDTSLMAKVTPSKLNHSVFNSGLLATLIGTLGRVLADFFITMGALLDVYVFIDFVNAIFFPLLVLAIGAHFLVRKYFNHFLVN